MYLLQVNREINMKLDTCFKPLERTAFGPWIAELKNLFPKSDLEKDTLEIAKQNLTKDDLAILANTVIKIDPEEKNLEVKKIISDYMGNIPNTMLEVQKFSLAEFEKFIINLPADYKEFENYFVDEEKKDGYSKIDSFKNVPSKDHLVKKCTGFENYNKISENTCILDDYLKLHDEYKDVIPHELLGLHSNFDYGYSGV